MINAGRVAVPASLFELQVALVPTTNRLQPIHDQPQQASRCWRGHETASSSSFPLPLKFLVLGNIQRWRVRAWKPKYWQIDKWYKIINTRTAFIIKKKLQ